MKSTTVVLIHGLAAGRWMLRPLERHLQACGYRTANWGYPSILRDIPWHARRLSQKLAALERSSEVRQVQLVTHSMGGIVARTALLEAPLPKAKRLVMLAPPNHGSSVAAVLSRGLGWVCQPLAQLGHGEDSYVNALPPPTGIQVGIIAATHDRVVSVDSTRLSTAADHWAVASGHNSLLFRRDVAQNVSNFLCHGRFAEAHGHPH
ncbi:MAG TPA: hypothetical protein DCY79_07770 [Planctomycetaceae bacterium]|nr:hypothetical protein [Blastopirellula sp.]HAY79688.1 hypothetical protein [Planctomycetaceae bacterium]|tara:strand:+ start:106 stop:723 length:618 start_codon:yes stop_codon:yes gene_type:complete